MFLDPFFCGLLVSQPGIVFGFVLFHSFQLFLELLVVCPAAHILPIHFERRFFSFLLPTDVLHLLDTSLLVSSLVVSRLVVSVSSWLLLLFLDTSWVLLSGCWLYFLRRNRSKDSLDIRVLLLFFLPLRCILRGLFFFLFLILTGSGSSCFCTAISSGSSFFSASLLMLSFI